MRKQWLIFLQLAFETQGTLSWHDSVIPQKIKRGLAGDNDASDVFSREGGIQVKDGKANEQAHVHTDTPEDTAAKNTKRAQ